MSVADENLVLPRGRHAAPREVVARSQRGRMLVAMAAAVADKGYARVAVADVIERARVSRRSFYEHFENKEDCFLAAYDVGVDLLLGAIESAVADAGDDLAAAAEAGTRAYLGILATNPDFAHTFLIEVLAAGPRALARRSAVHERFAGQIAAGYRAAGDGGRPEPPPYVFRACVGAIHELICDELVERGPEALPGLLGPVLDIQLRLIGR
jgi:AcrR family transcriptional regulator